jgi:hypothetical protein
MYFENILYSWNDSLKKEEGFYVSCITRFVPNIIKINKIAHMKSWKEIKMVSHANCNQVYDLIALTINTWSLWFDCIDIKFTIWLA